MTQLSLGLIETVGLVAAIEAADAALKSANVALVGYENTRGGGMIVVKVEGEVGAVNAAVAAAAAAGARVNGVVSTRVIPRPSSALEGLVHNAETVGAHRMEKEEPPPLPQTPSVEVLPDLDPPSSEATCSSEQQVLGEVEQQTPGEVSISETVESVLETIPETPVTEVVPPKTEPVRKNRRTKNQAPGLKGE